MRYYGDRPSYDASRVVPRNLTGYAPGRWQEPCPSQPAKAKGLENLSSAADEDRLWLNGETSGKFSPNEDLSGRVHPVTATAYKPVHGGYPTAEKRHPDAVVMDRTGQITREIYADQPIQAYEPLYFEAHKLAQGLGHIAHDWQAKAWKVQTTLRDYRLAQTKQDRAHIAILLMRLVWQYDSKEARMASEIENTINTIDM